MTPALQTKHEGISDVGCRITGGEIMNSSETTPNYEVGYGRPPVTHRIKPGQVLNPRGRPKGQQNIRTVLEQELNGKVTIREGNRTRIMTKLNVFLVKLINDAASGDKKAQANLIALLRAANMMAAPDVSTHQVPVTTDDDAVIADFFDRNRNALEVMKPSEPPVSRTG